MSARRSRHMLVVGVMWLIGVGFARADVIYVKWDAAGDNNGTTWQDAFNSLQDALAIAQADDQIWVASGTYCPDGGYRAADGAGGVLGTGDSAAKFHLLAGVEVFGGFAGSETSLTERIVPIQLERTTILSGDLLGDDEALGGSKVENSYRIVSCTDLAVPARLDGFTVERGRNTSWATDMKGAGIYVSNASPVICNCTVRLNTAETTVYGGSGIGMAVGGASSIQVVNCQFIKNTGPGGPGLCINASSGIPWVVNCAFWANSGRYGCALVPGGAQVVNCTIAYNNGDEGYAIQAGGGCSIRNCIVWGNQTPAVPNGVNVAYSCVNNSAYAGSDGNIIEDPLFMDPDGDDNELGTADDNLRLSPDSPCIEMGSNTAVPEWITTDIEATPRFVDGDGDELLTVDMGAYEWDEFCLPAQCPGTRVWSEPTGGVFQDHANWTLSAPDCTTAAVFMLGDTYPVTFEGAAYTKRLSFWSGNVSFDLGTGPFRSYSLCSTSPLGSLVLGERPDDNAHLTIAGNGELSTPFGSVVDIGSDEDSEGHLIVDGPGTSLFFGGDLCIGCAGVGTMDIMNGASVTSFTAAIADLPGSTGTVTVTGADSEWIVPFSLVIGNPAPLTGEPTAKLIVEDEGLVDVGPGGILIFQNGLITGNGTVRCDVVSIGGVEPGQSPGVLTIEGSYEQVSRIPGFGVDSGHLNLEVGGTEPGQYDQLVVTESAELGGGLFIKLINDFMPTGETDLPLLVTPTRGNSRFDVAFFPGITGNRFLTLEYAERGAGDVHMVTLPLPGDIDLTDPEEASVTGVPNAVAVGDFDGDDMDDLVITIPDTSGLDGKAVVLLTRFTGDVYTPDAAEYTMGVEPCAIAVGEFDGDPGIDIAVANAGSDDVYVLTNMGETEEGTFNPAIVFPVGSEPRSLLAGDFDKNGHLDLAVANAGDGTIGILLGGTGRAIFADWGQHLYPGAPPVVFTVDPFDPDNDDDDDIGVTCWDEEDGVGTVVIFENIQDVSGLAFDDPRTMLVGRSPVRLGTADLNHDGNQDLVTVNQLDGTVSVLLHATGGSDALAYAPAVDLPVRDDPAGSDPRSLALFDVDEDGDLDLVVVAENDSLNVMVRMLRNDLSGNQLAFASAIDLDTGTNSPIAVTAADLNGDQKDDLVALNQSTTKGGRQEGGVVVRLNVAPGDLDGNGSIDMDDVELFVTVLLGSDTDPIHMERADCDNSGVADGGDVEPFIGFLVSE